MSDIVTRARELLAGITPGKWELIGGGEYITGPSILVAPDDGGVSSEDAEFIAAAPQLVADLAAEVERLRSYKSLPPSMVWQDYYSPDDVCKIQAEAERLREALNRVCQIIAADDARGAMPGFITLDKLRAALEADHG